MAFCVHCQGPHKLSESGTDTTLVTSLPVPSPFFPPSPFGLSLEVGLRNPDRSHGCQHPQTLMSGVRHSDIPKFCFIFIIL